MAKIKVKRRMKTTLPSLKEKFVEICKPGDPLADLEDMSHARLTLKPDVTLGLHRLGGKTVTFDVVDPSTDFHNVTVDDTGMRLSFSNDEDVYE